jgi:hypothetical protein
MVDAIMAAYQEKKRGLAMICQRERLKNLFESHPDEWIPSRSSLKCTSLNMEPDQGIRTQRHDD